MSSDVSRVAVVIPNWNGEDFLAECLESLLKQTYVNAKIVVVDNGSRDSSLEILRNFPDVHVIVLNRNYGFAGGVNRGIEWSLAQGYRYVALFNNDAVAEPDWLQRLVETADAHPEAGLVTCKFLRFGDRSILDSTGEFFSVLGMPFPRGRDERDVGQYDSSDGQLIFAGTGGASLYRAVTLAEIGLFDEEFFAYYEDVDISFRMQLANWKVRYAPAAKAYHRIGGTSGKLGNFARYHSVKNSYYLYFKNVPGWLFWKYLPKFVAGMLLITGNCWLQGQFFTWLRAMGRMLRNAPAMLRERRRIQRQRKVSLRYVDAILYAFIPPIHRRWGKHSPSPTITNLGS